MSQLLIDGGDSEQQATALAELLTALDSAGTPGELMAMRRHMWYRLAIELSQMHAGIFDSFTKIYKPLRKVKPAKACQVWAEEAGHEE